MSFVYFPVCCLFNEMRYINQRFTYLFTYLLTSLVVRTSATDCLETLVSETTCYFYLLCYVCYVLSRTLNSAQSVVNQTTFGDTST